MALILHPTEKGKTAERVQWIRPELVCEVAFAEWTDHGELRQTTFLGWRVDKRPEEVALEEPNTK